MNANVDVSSHWLSNGQQGNIQEATMHSKHAVSKTPPDCICSATSVYMFCVMNVYVSEYECTCMWSNPYMVPRHAVYDIYLICVDWLS